MLLADIGLVQSAMTALQVKPDLVDQIVSVLRASSEDLGNHRVEDVGSDSFGGSPKAHELGGHATKAHQAIVEEFQELVDSLRKYDEAITKWAAEVSDVDATTNAEMTTRAQALEEVNTTLEQAREQATDDAIGDGKHDPTTTPTTSEDDS